MVSINDPGRTEDNGRAILNLTTGVWYINIKNTVGPGELLLEWRNYLGGN